MRTALFPETRLAVLGLFVLNPGQRLHLREVARRVGKPVGSIQRELALLTRDGVLMRQAEGNRTYFRANTSCPIYPELRGMALKTFGLADVLRDALAPLGGQVKAAAVYGSMARGDAGPQSDVDLLIVGDVDAAKLAAAVRQAEETLRRPVNYTLLSSSELTGRRREKSGFLARVLAGPRVAVVGDLDEL